MRPAYTTEYGAATADAGTVVDVVVAPERRLPERPPGGAQGAARSRKQRLEQIIRQGGDGGFQCLSMDVWGTVRQWNIVDATPVDAADLGLRIGGRKRIIESKVVRVEAFSPKPLMALTNRAAAAAAAAAADPGEAGAPAGAHSPKLSQIAQARRLRCIQGSSEEFLVGTDDGRCLRGSRFGKRPLCPRRFEREDSPGQALGAAVTGLDFSDAAPGLFAVGYDDGAVAVFRKRSTLPLRAWEGFATGGILEVKWCPSQPHVVLALDGASRAPPRRPRGASAPCAGAAAPGEVRPLGRRLRGAPGGDGCGRRGGGGGRPGRALPRPGRLCGRRALPPPAPPRGCRGARGRRARRPPRPRLARRRGERRGRGGWPAPARIEKLREEK